MGLSALITGAAKRIGRAIALALARAGANVLIHYHSSEREAEELAGEIRKRGVKALILAADLSVPAEVKTFWLNAGENAGPFDILINNASIFPQDRLVDFSPEDLVRNININALAPTLLSRAFAAGGRRGSIINLLDCRIVDYDAGHVGYHLSKRMLFSLTRMMALEFAPNIRVNAVAPGLILPPEDSDAGYRERQAGTNCLKRWGRPEDVTRAVLFLLESDFITGQVVYVDGGRFLKGSVYGR